MKFVLEVILFLLGQFAVINRCLII